MPDLPLGVIISCMLRILFIILALLSLQSVAEAAGVIDQKLFIHLSPAEHLLQAKAVLSPTEGQSGWPPELLLAERAEIDTLTADGNPVSYVFENGHLQISLPNGTSSLAITYRIRFDDPVPQDPVGIEDPSYGVSATIMPEGTYLSANSGWHPLPVDADSQFLVTISGPPGLTGVTSGRLVDHTTRSTETRTTWQTQTPQTALTLAAGSYRLFRDDLGEIQVLAFFGAANASLAKGYLDACREYLQLYQALFGPYPYAKFAVVENFYPTGYGLPGWTLLGSSVIRLPFIRSTSLPHEIAHAWWGNAIAVDYRSGNWCEGLATYVADYYLKELHDPASALEYRRKILRDYAALVESGDDLPLSAFHSRTTKRDQAVGYGKSAMVFHMLRNRIGDQAFWAGLQAAARKGLGKRYAWSDLQRHFEEASGTKLDLFFQQWIQWTGAPQLRLTEVQAKAVADGWQVTGTLAQAAPPYDLLVPVRLETATLAVAQVIPLRAGENSFAFTVTDAPVNLSVDPTNEIFRKLYPEEVPATVNNLRASRAPLVVVATGADALLDAARDLLRGLQWNRVPVLSEKDYLAQRPVNHDLLMLGWPESRELRPELPDGIHITGQQFTIDDKLYAGTGDVLFMVVDSHQTRRVAGYFVTGSVGAAEDAARRIPHYGRYSLLVFRNGQNQIKSTWEPVKSPLKYLFVEEAAQ
jgi:aminopeptidase N